MQEQHEKEESLLDCPPPTSFPLSPLRTKAATPAPIVASSISSSLPFENDDIVEIYDRAAGYNYSNESSFKHPTNNSPRHMHTNDDGADNEVEVLGLFSKQRNTSDTSYGDEVVDEDFSTYITPPEEDEVSFFFITIYT